jgi:four helix bundle protein
MAIEKFEDAIVWQKSKGFAVDIYKLFKGCKDFSFRDQIQRASISISNNIAEGFERRSNKEFKYFLYISKGSSGETRSMLYVAKELGYINEIDFEAVYPKSCEISRMLSGLIKTV